MYSYEKTTLISCRNIEVVFSYVFLVSVFVYPYLQLYEADLRLLQQSVEYPYTISPVRMSGTYSCLNSIFWFLNSNIF